MNSNLIHLLLTLAGLALFGFATWQFQITRNLLQNGRKTTGVVADLGKYQDSEGDDMYQPVFQYQDERGETHQFKQGYSSNVIGFKLGEEIMVVYDLQYQMKPRIVSFWGLYRASILGACLALPLLLMGLGYFLFRLQS